MNITVSEISLNRKKKEFTLLVQFGSESPQGYRASYEEIPSGGFYCGLDEQLFMHLSNLGVERYCNCAVYQMELTEILRSILNGTFHQEFPIELGTTSYARIPSRWKVRWNRFRSPIYRRWMWFRSRKIRERNLQRYANKA